MGCLNAIMLRCWELSCCSRPRRKVKLPVWGARGGTWTATCLRGAAYAWAALRASRVEAAPSLGPPRDCAPFAADRTAGAGRSASDCLGGGAGRVREDDAAVAVGRAQRPALRLGIAGRAGQRPEDPAHLRRRSARCGWSRSASRYSTCSASPGSSVPGPVRLRARVCFLVDDLTSGPGPVRRARATANPECWAAVSVLADHVPPGSRLGAVRAGRASACPRAAARRGQDVEIGLRRSALTHEEASVPVAQRRRADR